MILESRKWRLIIRIVALALASVLMLAVAGPASYALQDDTPKHITIARQMYDEKGKPVADRFIYIEAAPDLHNAVTTGEGGSTRYWIPIQGFGHELFIRTDKGSYLFPYDYDPATGFQGAGAPVFYIGKVTTLKSQPDADKALDELAARGVVADKDTAMVLLQGEEPSNYRPMVPVMPLLALFWIAALAGAWQIWRGKRSRRRVAQPAF